MNVGIDAIEVQPGKLCLDLPNTFAEQRDEEPEKYTKGLGLYAAAFPDAHEDIVTMGANAAKRLMDRHELQPDDIGRIDVATESSFDNSKPISTYIAGCLEQVYDGSFAHANKGERKFACIAGTQALDDACNWIRAGRNKEKAALVIATDTALYRRGGAGEGTQGAGAVAMLVTENPRVVTLSTEQGYGSADKTDFLKPNQQFPSVDGKRSMHVYLARMREAMEAYKADTEDKSLADFEYVPFHTPFPGMVRKAAVLGFRNWIRDTELEQELEAEIGRHIPRESEFDHREHFEESIREYTTSLKETEQYKEWYAETIEPTLNISSHVGNWYTGSVHIARLSALKTAYEDGQDLVGSNLLVASYGSGAQAEVHHETVQDGWVDELEQQTVDEQLDAQKEITYKQYEHIHDVHNHSKNTNREEFTEPQEEFVFTGVGRMGEREYTYIN